MSRFPMLSVLLLCLVPILLVSAASPPSSNATQSPDTTDPNLISIVPQPGSTGFQWFAGITTTGTTNPNEYLFEFQTINSGTPAVEYVDIHYSINNLALQNWRLINATNPFLFTHIIVLESTDQIQFNFTYFSVDLLAAVNTYTYEYSPITSPPSISQVTIVTIPIPSTAVYSPVQQAGNFNWLVGIQKYSNLPELFTINFHSSSISSIDWVNIHYIITNQLNIDGALQNYRLNKNSTVPSDSSVNFYLDITNLQQNEKIKFNFTYWNIQDEVAQDTTAFLWTPTSNVINYIGNIADSNVNVNPQGGTGIYGSTGVYATSTAQSSGVVSSTGTTSHNNTTTPHVNGVLKQTGGLAVSAVCALVAVLAVVVM